MDGFSTCCIHLADSKQLAGFAGEFAEDKLQFIQHCLGESISVIEDDMVVRDPAMCISYLLRFVVCCLFSSDNQNPKQP